ncbi:MAG: dethiobiotin synthase [Thermoguttaceae bacterium]
MNDLPGLFITGTDTGVGKTYVGGLIARQLAAQGHRVGVYKPAASGCLRQNGTLVSEDAVALWEAAGRPGDLEHVCPQRFAAPLAPHLAAAAEGRRLDAELMRRGLDYWRERSDVLLVEGAGGLLSPMGEREYNADLAAAFGLPLVVVARNVLGCVNHALQTLVVAATFGRWQNPTAPILWGGVGQNGSSEGLPVAGIVMNEPVAPPADDASLSLNARELANRCTVPLLAEIAWGDVAGPTADWFSLAKGWKR